MPAAEPYSFPRHIVLVNKPNGIATPMTLIQIIEKVGPENVIVQPLNSCITGAHSRKQGMTEIRFLTEQFTPNDLLKASQGEEPAKVGVIVWLPADKL